MKKIDLLPESDITEVIMFQRYLDDQRTMEPIAFYRKHQEYMGLSNTELERIIGKLLAKDQP